MTGPAFRHALDQLGLTQIGLGRVLGVDPRTVRRWADQGLDGPAAILIRLLLRGKLTPADITKAGQ
jgi:DNA-binding transcriptional regulator YiaG